MDQKEAGVDADVDVLVIGGGPAGLHAALESAHLGKKVMLVDEEPDVGGACVRRGTIPSKTLRETAQAFALLREKSGGVVELALPDNTALDSLYARNSAVVQAHERTWGKHLRDGGVDVVHGRARFVDGGGGHLVVVQTVKRVRVRVRAAQVVLATGSRPRTPDNVPIDHETVLDSDSILSLPWLPKSLIVIGSGVIATEYAAIFAALGVAVVCVDKAPRPLMFLDSEIVESYSRTFAERGGQFFGGRSVESVALRPGGVEVIVDDGRRFTADKLLCALGRVANVESLGLAHAGLATDARGLIVVDGSYRTAVPHIFAVGDVIGPPSLASTSMEQGRRAARVAAGQPSSSVSSSVPVGVYAIPELGSVGLAEADAAKAGVDVVVGRASFGDTARGVISASAGGMLKLVCSADGARVLGAQAVGEGAAELVHLAQMAMLGGLSPQVFVEHAFNFPTLAEAYRIAALDVAAQVARRAAPGASAASLSASTTAAAA